MQPINYNLLWSTMQIKPDWLVRVHQDAQAIAVIKDVYADFVKTYNDAMPWYFVGLIDLREGSGGARKHLHNGDSLLRRTVNVPKGRPLADPINGFSRGYTWVESATDALNMQGWQYETSWTIEQILSRLESYNGYGYEMYHDMNSPYCWSGTNHYDKGKYDTDGHFNPDLVDEQVGIAPILKVLMDVH